MLLQFSRTVFQISGGTTGRCEEAIVALLLLLWSRWKIKVTSLSGGAVRRVGMRPPVSRSFTIRFVALP